MSVTDRRPPFRFAVRTRVGFDETDAQGIVYYGRYMPYFDRARVEYLRHLGLLRPGSSGAEFVMRAQHVEYHAPARFDDELEVFVRVRRLGRTSVTWEFDAYNAASDEHLATSTQTAVYVTERRPVPVDDAMRSGGPRVRPGGRVVTADVLAEIERIAGGDESSDQILRRVVDLLADRVATYSWVGIYFVEGDELVLGPWQGPEATEHVRIPVGQGVCGAAAASGKTEIVDDVNADERYLSCFLSTRSEIVVPIIYDHLVVAEIDIDSDTPAAFGDSDRELLERVAAVIAEHCLVGWDTGGVDWEAPENWEDSR